MRERYSDDIKQRRHAKVKEVIRREIVDITKRLVKDPRMSSFTITDLFLKHDMKSATVYVAKFAVDGEPTEESKTELVKGLQSASHFIYEQLKRRLRMKVIPSLKFEYDFQLAEASRLWDLVRRVNEAPVEVETDAEAEAVAQARGEGDHEDRRS